MPALSRSYSFRRWTTATRTWASRLQLPPGSAGARAGWPRRYSRGGLHPSALVCSTRRSCCHWRPMNHRLILWNIDLTLVDVVRVARDAYAEAFRRVTGRPLVALPQIAGRTDSEIFFEALAFNQAASGPIEAGGQEMLATYIRELADAFAARRQLLTEQGRVLPGAREAVAASAELPGVVQSVLTGSIRPNAVAKLHAFGLEQYFDLEIGGYGSEVYLKGAQLLDSRSRAAAKYGAALRARFDGVPGRLQPGCRSGQRGRRALHRGGQRPVDRE